MAYSMTGYGRGEAESEYKKLVIEIKTVNHRYNDIIIKMPKKLLMFEDKMKKMLKSKISRGRIEVFVNFSEVKGDDCVITPNFKILDQYKSALEAIKDQYGIEKDVDLNLLAKYPDAIKIEYLDADEELMWQLISDSMNVAIESLMEMRSDEGAILITDMTERLNILRDTLLLIEARGPEIVTVHQEKMKQRILELLDDAVELDEQKIIHEVAFFADKTNITEEVVRLRSHLEQFETISIKEEPIGRKLDFLIQEVNREVNTIGSKSPDIDISNHVIELKSELEKIREQVQNIE